MTIKVKSYARSITLTNRLSLEFSLQANNAILFSLRFFWLRVTPGRNVSALPGTPISEAVGVERNPLGTLLATHRGGWIQFASRYVAISEPTVLRRL